MCIGSNAPARVNTINYSDKTITEAKYVCPRCISVIKIVPISTELKNK
jgi:hypothetical protein